ncbi:ethanolamine kinase 1-like [Lineus longissimus]|uniref:ethanolamine kinase 1-like n=1 Tax=Lineus longissimus TaxID=88925 RepID=UPI002B4C8E5F
MKPVFCYNDINITNLVYQSGNDRVIFLDYEWAGFSSVAYEIGYHLASVHSGTAKDLTGLMPTDSYVREWVSKYLRKKAQITGSGEMVSEYAISKLVHEVDVLMPITVFLVALICIRLASLPEKEDKLGFDYIGNGAARFDYYFKSKKEP